MDFKVIYNKIITNIAYYFYIGKGNKNLNPTTIEKADLFCKKYKLKK